MAKLPHITDWRPPEAEPQGCTAGKGTRVIAYRCYLLDKDGHIGGIQVIECPSDGAALAEAERRLAAGECPAIEVWDRARRVGRVGQANDEPERIAKKPRTSVDFLPEQGL